MTNWGALDIIYNPMLNIPVIQAKRRELGLSGPALANMCGVSREAVSNWLKGESEPRPSKAVLLAKALGLDLRDLLAQAPSQSEPIVAYRTRLNRPVSGFAAESAQELAANLQRLAQHLPERAKLGIAKDLAPKATESHVRVVAADMRSRLGLSDLDVVEEKHVLELFRHFGAVLVPVFWGVDKERHENALNVYLPELESSFVVFNLGCRADDYLYWLCHEFGHCLSLHALQGKDGEDYAELFAQQFLFPAAAAAACSSDIGRSKGESAFKVIDAWAERYGISSITVIRGVDKYRVAHDQGVKLEAPSFWARFGALRGSRASMIERLLGSENPSADSIIQVASGRYGSPVYTALEALQKAEGGRLPTLIQSTLMVTFSDAVALSIALWRS